MNETTTKNIHSIQGLAKGKRSPSKRDSICLSDFLISLPAFPITDLAPNLNYPMDGNDRVGDCVIAQWDHFNQLCKYLLTGVSTNFTMAQIWAFYKTQNPGFDPNGTASTNGPGSIHDNGMDIQTFLEYLVANKYIVAFASVDWKNDNQFKSAINLGLALMGGVQLQNAQMDQFNQGKPWDYVPGGSIDGGHAVPPVSYDLTGFELITWGKKIRFTKAFKDNCFDECWVVITQDHLNHPEFWKYVDVSALSAALSQLTNGKIVIPTTQRLLKLTTPYMTGADVKAVQVLLNMPLAQQDSVYGPHTVLLVKAFQTAHGLTADGIVGPATLALLKKKS